MVETSNQKTVLITDASGYVGSYVLNEFLCGEGKGKYRIRATVTNKDDIEEMKALNEFFGDQLQQVEFINMDFKNEDQIEAAVNGCNFILHTTKPKAEYDDWTEFIDVSINAVKFFLKAAQKHNVTRFVFITSTDAVSRKKIEDCPDTFDENDYSDLSTVQSWILPRTCILVERAAQDFKKQMEDQSKFCPEIVTLISSWCSGQIISFNQGQKQFDIVRKLILNQVPFVLDIKMSWVDIKDLAKGFLRAMERPEAANQRIILSDVGVLSVTDLTQLLWKVNCLCRSQNLKIPPVKSCCYLWYKSWQSKENAEVYYFTGQPARPYNNNKSKLILGIEYRRELFDLLVETVESLTKLGLLPEKQFNST